MAFCTKCGKDMEEAKFCPACGAPAASAAAPQVAGAQYPPPAPGMAPPHPPPPPGVPYAPGPGMPPPAAPPRAAKGKQKSTGAMVFGIAGAVLMIIVAIGSALPWATASSELYSIKVGGLSGDGVITIIVAFLGLAFFAVGIIGKAKWPFVIGLIMSLIISAVAIYDAVDIARSVTMGIGLILCAIGGVLGVVAGIGGIASPRRAA